MYVGVCVCIMYIIYIIVCIYVKLFLFCPIVYISTVNLRDNLVRDYFIPLSTNIHALLRCFHNSLKPAYVKISGTVKCYTELSFTYQVIEQIYCQIYIL